MIEAKGEDILFGTSLEMKLQCQCHSKTVSLQFIPKPRCQIVCFKKSVWDDLQFDLIPLDTITSWGLWGTGVQLSLSITLSRSVPTSPEVLIFSSNNLLRSLAIRSDPTGDNYKLMISGALGSNCRCQLLWVGAYPRPQTFFFLLQTICLRWLATRPDPTGDNYKLIITGSPGSNCQCQLSCSRLQG